MFNIDWSFPNTFPLPYRVLIVSVIGLWAWGSNLQILSWASINVPQLLKLKSSQVQDRNSTAHRPIYTLAFIFTFWIGLNLFIFWQVTGGIEAKIAEWTSIPLVCYVVVFFIILCPFNILKRKERAKFLRLVYIYIYIFFFKKKKITFCNFYLSNKFSLNRCVRRIAFSNISDDVYFSDVIMADILTSFAKVFGDLYVTGCILLFYDVDQKENRCWSYIIAPLFTR